MKQFILIIFVCITQGVFCQNIQELFNSASMKLKVKDYKGAIEIYNMIALKDINNEKVYLLKGNCYDTLCNFPYAIQNYNKALELNSKSEYALIGIASIRLRISRFETAILDVNKAIEINPNNYLSYNIRGNIKEGLYDLNKTTILTDPMLDYELALKLKPNDVTTINNIANLKHRLGNSQDAIKEYNKSLSLNPNQPNTYYNLGNIKVVLHDSIGALKDYTSAIKLNPSEGAYYTERAKVYESFGDFKQSYRDFNDAIIIDSSLNAFIGRGLSAFNLKNYKSAKSDFTYIINQTIKADSANYNSFFNYDCPAAYYYRGYIHYYENQNFRACQDWENALKKGVKNAQELISTYCKLDPITYLNRGRTKYDMEDFNGALENLNTYLGTNPNSEEALIIRAHCKYMLKDYLGAIDDYNTCLTFNDKNIDAIFYRASSFNELGNYSAAIESYSICIKLNPKYTEAYYYRGQCYDNLKNYKNALLDYNKVIVLNPKMFESEIYFNRALVKTSLSDDLGAIDDYKKALTYDSKNAAIYINRGQLKFSLKDYNGALSDYNSALNIEPSFGMAYYYRGLTYLELNNNKNACEDLKIANDAGIQLAGIKLHEFCE